MFHHSFALTLDPLLMTSDFIPVVPAVIHITDKMDASAMIQKLITGCRNED